ncbi:MAG TPA: nuclear transport factor 2 family protein [Thermoanaerobaculaceae bacterium]|nr:nuclear transport factor 2 family protein [Thermoanaerobaculaceae bacterium]
MRKHPYSYVIRSAAQNHFTSAAHKEDPVSYCIRRTALCLTTLAIAIIGCAGTRSGRGERTTAADRAEIRSNLASLNTVCAARDLPGFMGLFEDSDDILFVGSDKGEVFQGRTAIARFMAKLFALPFTFSFDMQQVVIKRSGPFAWAYVDGNMVHTGDNGQAKKMPYRFSVAMVRTGGAWKWQLFDGAVPGGE